MVYKNKFGGVRKTREKIAEELFNLKSEEEFVREFKRTMNGCGLQVGQVHLNRALEIYRARHRT
jgi:hypothetical protein